MIWPSFSQFNKLLGVKGFQIILKMVWKGEGAKKIKKYINVTQGHLKYYGGTKNIIWLSKAVAFNVRSRALRSVVIVSL